MTTHRRRRNPLQAPLQRLNITHGRAVLVALLTVIATPGCLLEIGESSCADGLAASVNRIEYSVAAHRPQGCLLADGQTSTAAAQKVVDQLVPVLGANHGEKYHVVSTDADIYGAVHVRFRQEIHEIPVEGGEMIVHVDDSGREIAAVNGTFIPGDGLLARPVVDGPQALAEAVLSQAPDALILSDPVLRYVRNRDHEYQLAWKAIVSFHSERGPHLEAIFVDARDSSLVTRHPLLHDALFRKIYTANNTQKIADELLFEEGGTHGDPVATAVYDRLGASYAFWLDQFGRDSYDGAGAPLVATVHYGRDYANAFWNSNEQQLVFGDGNEDRSLTELDIVAHEYTHAVIGSTAELIYLSESGALNEAFADIAAMAVHARANGGVSSATWKIGEEGMTPAIDGDAMRYASSPRQDCQSSDFYPTRYTGRWDAGGVHINSGIANLAFYLLSVGGTHPRGVTDVVVPAIGIEAATEIFVRALTTYLVPSSNFHDARAATIQAARDLQGDGSAVEAVSSAWDAVGVSEPEAKPRKLQNGEVVVPLFGSAGSWKYFEIDVPAGVPQLLVDLSSTASNQGDYGTVSGPIKATIYVARFEKPDVDTFECAAKDSCAVDMPVEGTWYVGLFGSEETDYENLKLSVSFDAPAPKLLALESGIPVTGQSGARGGWKYFQIDVPVGTKTLDVTIDDACEGSGNVDLLVEHGRRPSGSFTDSMLGTFLKTPSMCGDHLSPQSGKGCRVPNPLPGQWYVGLLADSAYAGFDVTATLEGEGVPDVEPLQSDDSIIVAGERGDWRYFEIVVPEGSGRLAAWLRGGSGDADLYLKHAARPDLGAFDCRSIRAGGDEVCDVANPEPGTWYVGVRAYRSYQSVVLSASTGLVALRNSEKYRMTAKAGDWRKFVTEVSEETDKLIIDLNNADGASLFVRHEQAPTETDARCKKLTGADKKCVVREPALGRWYIGVKAEGEVSEAVLQVRAAKAYLIRD